MSADTSESSATEDLSSKLSDVEIGVESGGTQEIEPPSDDSSTVNTEKDAEVPKSATPSTETTSQGEVTLEVPARTRRKHHDEGMRFHWNEQEIWYPRL